MPYKTHSIRRFLHLAQTDSTLSAKECHMTANSLWHDARARCKCFTNASTFLSEWIANVSSSSQTQQVWPSDKSRGSPIYFKNMSTLCGAGRCNVSPALAFSPPRAFCSVHVQANRPSRWKSFQGQLPQTLPTQVEFFSHFSLLVKLDSHFIVC